MSAGALDDLTLTWTLRGRYGAAGTAAKKRKQTKEEYMK